MKMNRLTTLIMIAMVLGVVVGWWYQDPRSVDDLTAWLERGADEP